MTRLPGLQSKLYPPNWPEIARRIKDRANWRCEGCGVPHGAPPNVLTTHHIDYNPQNNEDDNLIALCQRCHLKVQGMMRQPRTRQEIIFRLKQRGRQIELRLDF